MGYSKNVYIGPYVEILEGQKFDRYDFCEKHFGNGDQFSNCEVEGKYLIIKNYPEQLGMHIDDAGIYEYPQPAKMHGDWSFLVDFLTKDGIKFVSNFGVIVYYV